MALSVCSACQRHVKGEGACPFCGGEAVASPGARKTAARTSRAAMIFGVAAVSVACGGSAVALYGAPAPDPDSGTGADAGDASSDARTTDASDGGPVAAYGAPGPDAAADAEADGGSVALYGAPAP